MRTFDVRENGDEPITEIRVVGSNPNFYCLDAIKQTEYLPGSIDLMDTDSERYLQIRSADHLDNLIKGLLKAKQLGWVK